MSKKYTMILAEDGSGWGNTYWIVYPDGGNYIHDELLRLPGGSRHLEKEARKALNKLNGVT